MDKLTTKSQEAFAEAIRLATDAGNLQVGSLHLLAALPTQQGEVAMALLDAVGINRGGVESRTNTVFTMLPISEDFSVQQPGTSRALSHAISDAGKETAVLGDAYISIEHLPIAVATSQSQAGEILQSAGAGREQLFMILPDARDNAKATNPDPRGMLQVLEEHGTDLMAAAREGKMDPMIDRNSEIRRVVQVLSRRTKNNPVLISGPDVGKTTVVEGLTQRTIDDGVPESLRGERFIQFDVTSMVVGTEYHGEFEERFKAVLQKIKDPAGEIAAFIDEIRTIVSASDDSEGAMSASNIFRPMFARGELWLIGTTTLDECREGIEEDLALERCFQQVYVGKPSVKDTVTILRGITPKYEAHHKMTISDDAPIATATPSNHYISGRQFPDKAVDLADKAASRLYTELDSSPKKVDAFQWQVDRLKMEEAYLVETEARDDVVAAGRLEKLRAKPADKSEELATLNARWESEKAGCNRAGELRVKPDELRTEFERAVHEGRYKDAGRPQNGDIPMTGVETVEAEAQGLAEADVDTEPMIAKCVDIDEIAGMISTWMDVPVGKLLQGKVGKLLSMEDVLGKRFIGQKNAAASVSDTVRRSHTGVTDPNRPLGSFLFLGPASVSRTELTRPLAELMFDDDHAIVRIDMPEYSEKHSVLRLISAPPGYVGYEEGGQLTEAARRRPYPATLLNEIEKASLDVFDILLQVFDDGCLTNGQGRTVDFKNTTLTLTSNLGSQALMDPTLDESQKHEAVMASAWKTFRPRFINRFDDVIVFDPLSLEKPGKIVDLQMEQMARRLKPQWITLNVTDAAREFLAMDGYGPAYGARPLRWLIQRETDDKLARMLLPGETTDGATVTVDTDSSDSVPGLKLTVREQCCGWWLVGGCV